MFSLFKTKSELQNLKLELSQAKSLVQTQAIELEACRLQVQVAKKAQAIAEEHSQTNLSTLSHLQSFGQSMLELQTSLATLANRLRDEKGKRGGSSGYLIN